MAVDEWIWPKPTEYAGVRFRSRLEAWWAATLDQYGIRWEYEPRNEDGTYLTLALPSGARYRPDFWLHDISTILEVKGAHRLGTEKPAELGKIAREIAKEGGRDWIVLLGWAPERCTEPEQPEYFMRWADAAGYNALLTRCGDCYAWQWSRPRFSRRCRSCDAILNGHHAGPQDDMSFDGSRLLFGKTGLCPGFASTTHFTATPRSLRLGTRQSAYTSAVAHTALSI